MCRDARSVRPSPLSFTAFRLQRPGRSTTDAQSERPYKGLYVNSGYSSHFNGDGRSDRASLQDSVTASIVVLTGMDAQTERPYKIQSRLVSSHSASVVSKVTASWY